jgi:hypothetical protein
LTLVEGAQAGALDRGDVHEYVSAAVLRLNESITFRRVEPFHGASSHHGLLCLYERDHDRTTIVRSLIRNQRCLWEGTPAGARQNKAKLEHKNCTRFSQMDQPRDVINNKRSNGLDNLTNQAQPESPSAIILNPSYSTAGAGWQRDQSRSRL